MAEPLGDREAIRLVLQGELDSAKDQAERNRMGQFATPTKLASEILQYARMQLKHPCEVRFIDPAIGTGSFFSALLESFPKDRVARAVGYEVGLTLRRASVEAVGRYGARCSPRGLHTGRTSIGRRENSIC